MKTIWHKCGNVVFWLTWPGIYLSLRFTTRTRALISHDNEIVVVKPWLGNGKWGLPGGGVHVSEDALTALLREVKEETAVLLDRNSCKKIRNDEYRSSGLRFVYSLYAAALKTKPTLIEQPGEIVAAEWVKRTDLNPKNANRDVLDAITSSKT